MPLYICTTISVSIHLSMNIIHASEAGLLYTVLQWTSTCMCVSKYDFLQILAQKWSCLVALLFVFWKTSYVLSILTVVIYIFLKCKGDSLFSRFSLRLIVCSLLMLAVGIGVKLFLGVVVVSISLIGPGWAVSLFLSFVNRIDKKYLLTGFLKAAFFWILLWLPQNMSIFPYNIWRLIN